MFHAETSLGEDRCSSESCSRMEDEGEGALVADKGRISGNVVDLFCVDENCQCGACAVPQRWCRSA